MPYMFSSVRHLSFDKAIISTSHHLRLLHISAHEGDMEPCGFTIFPCCGMLSHTLHTSNHSICDQYPPSTFLVQGGEHNVDAYTKTGATSLPEIQTARPQQPSQRTRDIGIAIGTDMIPAVVVGYDNTLESTLLISRGVTEEPRTGQRAVVRIPQQQGPIGNEVYPVCCTCVPTEKGLEGCRTGVLHPVICGSTELYICNDMQVAAAAPATVLNVHGMLVLSPMEQQQQVWRVVVEDGGAREPVMDKNDASDNVTGGNTETKPAGTSIRAPEFWKVLELAAKFSGGEGETAGKKHGRRGSCDFLGVSKHKKSGRYEAHIWLSTLGKQLYLGGFESPLAAACAYDLVAIKVKLTLSKTNFPHRIYKEHYNWIESSNLSEVVSYVKRQSWGFSRGHSKYRGVTQHTNGRVEARIGVGAKRHIYLGMYGTKEDAARHYDEALVRLKGPSAATNFPLGGYPDQLKDHEKMKQVLAEGNKFWREKDLVMWIKNGMFSDKLNGNISNRI